MQVDSIAVSLFGNMTVEPGEMHIITKELAHRYAIFLCALDVEI